MLIAIVMAVIGGYERTAWLGAAIASVPLPLLAVRLAFVPVERTSENLPLLLLIASFGVLVASWEQFLEGTSGWIPTSVALLSALILWLYVFCPAPARLPAIGQSPPRYHRRVVVEILRHAGFAPVFLFL